MREPRLTARSHSAGRLGYADVAAVDVLLDPYRATGGVLGISGVRYGGWIVATAGGKVRFV